MDILNLFRAEGTNLYWARLPDDQVDGRPSGEPIEPDRHYVNVRLAEMYLGRSRTLWRKFSPLLHAFTTYGGDEQPPSVAGPGQLQQLGEANLDRVVVLNLRLAGPIPYQGAELSIVAGLYSVPREDAAAALVTTLGALAEVAGPGAKDALKLAQIVKSGVDSVLSLNTTRLRLGVLDAFGGANPLRSGFHVGIGAPAADVPTQDLWLDEGRLRQGSRLNPLSYNGQDYFILQLERIDRRPDWPGLPGIEPLNQRFQAIMAGAQDVDGKRAALNGIWTQFTQALIDSQYLTRFDADEIIKDVEEDLQKRLEAMEGSGPFEQKSWGAKQPEEQSPREFDLAAVPTAEDGRAEALGPQPF
jgi:hypothetical protein